MINNRCLRNQLSACNLWRLTYTFGEDRLQTEYFNEAYQKRLRPRIGEEYEKQHS